MSPTAQTTSTQKRTHALGKVIASRTALIRLGEEMINELLRRHLRGDWGKLGRIEAVTLTDEIRKFGSLITADDATLNALAIEQKAGRVMSRYRVGGEDYYVITDGLGMPEAYTTVLLCSEY